MDEQKPKRKLKRKQYAVRLGGELVRKRFTTAELGRSWQRKEREEYEAALHGIKVKREPMEIDSVVDRFLDSRSKLASRKHDEMRLRTYVLPHFSGRKLNEITKHEWMELFGDGSLKKEGLLVRQYELSPRTSNMIRTLVQTMYEHARKYLNAVSENPIKDITRLREPKKKFRCFRSDAEVKAFLEAASQDNPSYFAFVMIAINTGLRLGNITTLKWCDINFERGSILVRRKYDYADNAVKEGLKAHDGDELEIGLTDSLRAFLVGWRATSKYVSKDDFVCAAQETGKMLCRSTLQGCHERTIERAKVEYVNIHGIRHTYATMYLERGGSIYDLKHILNHSTVTITELYTHNTKNRLRETANVMNVELPSAPSNIAEFKRPTKK